MLKKRNGILRKNRGKGIENLTYPYMGAGGVKNFQNHPYVIIEWPLISNSFHGNEKIQNESMCMT